MESTKEDIKNFDQLILHVRGLPSQASKDDIIKFFHDSKIKNGASGVYLILSEEEGPSGEAYVVFETEYDIQKGLQKHNEHLGSRYIEVSRSTENEMKCALACCGLIGENAFGDACVPPRGLPYGCSKEEIAQFFTVISNNDVTMKLHDSERNVQKISEQKNIIEELKEEKKKLAKKWTNTIDKADLLNSRKIVEDQTLKICNLEMNETLFKEENDALKSENKSLKEKIDDLCKELSKTTDMLKVESDDKMKRLSSEIINLQKQNIFLKASLDEAEKERTQAIHAVLQLCKVYNIGPDNWEAFRSEENTMVGAHGQEASGSEENAMVQKASLKGQEMGGLDTISITDKTPNVTTRLSKRRRVKS